MTHGLVDSLLVREVCLWAAGKEAPLESEEILKRRRMIKEGAALMQSAIKRFSPDWKRGANTADYKRGRTLLLEADPSSIVPLAELFRSSELRPTKLPKLDSSTEDWDVAVKEVVEKRRSLLSNRLVASGSFMESARILAFIPAESLSDGAASYPSRGILDDDNVPAWDLWAKYSEGTLFSVVPGTFVSLVEAGIDANPEQCLQWAK